MSMESINDVWAAVCDELKSRMTEVSFNVWLSDLEPVNLTPEFFFLSIASEYKKEIIEMNYRSIIEDCIKEIMGIPLTLVVLIKDEEGELKSANQLHSSKPSDNFEDNFTFDNFVVGSCNRFAHAAAMAIAEKPEQSKDFIPFLIYGNSGVGKTHLMLAIKNRMKALFPEKNIVYTRCEEFTNNLISDLHSGNIENFRKRYRTADVLMIDDIQFIAGKESTMEEFFNTFNELLQAGKIIIVTSDRPPKDMKTLEERLRTRLESGVMADITPPDFETRVGILNSKAELLGLTIDQNIIYYIAENIKINTRQLEGVIKKLQAFVMLQGKKPTIAIAQNYIKDIITSQAPEPIKMEEIIKAVSEQYNIPENDIISKRKTAPIVFARQLSMYIARETTELSYKAIGESFGKDHSTVLFSVEKIEKHLKEHPYENDMVNDIIKTLKKEN